MFSEKNDQYRYLMAPSSGLTTKTAGLFDSHLEDKNIHLSCMQTHFHAPAEHAIDG